MLKIVPTSGQFEEERVRPTPKNPLVSRLWPGVTPLTCL